MMSWYGVGTRFGDEDPKMDKFLDGIKTTSSIRKEHEPENWLSSLESKETACMHQENLEKKKFKKVLCIDASNRKTMQNTIARTSMPTMRVNTRMTLISSSRRKFWPRASTCIVPTSS